VEPKAQALWVLGPMSYCASVPGMNGGRFALVGLLSGGLTLLGWGKHGEMNSWARAQLWVGLKRATGGRRAFKRGRPDREHGRNSLRFVGHVPARTLAPLEQNYDPKQDAGRELVGRGRFDHGVTVLPSGGASSSSRRSVPESAAHLSIRRVV